MGGTWHGVIPKLSEHPEVVYSLFAIHSARKVALWNAINGWTGVDPGRCSQMLAPYGTATLEGCPTEGWDMSDAQEYLNARAKTKTVSQVLSFSSLCPDQ